MNDQTEIKSPVRNRIGFAAQCAAALLLLGAAAGCQSNHIPQISEAVQNASSESLVLHAGDVVAVKFPGATELDTTVTVRSDGMITVGELGEVKVSGLTPAQARDAVLEAAKAKTKLRDASVTVQKSAFIIYVTGAVERPGEMVSDRSLTPFEAVIKAGFDNEKSNLAKVKIIRIDKDNNVSQRQLNLKEIITKAKQEPFTLQPFDVIYVPEKFSWF